MLDFIINAAMLAVAIFTGTVAVDWYRKNHR